MAKVKQEEEKYYALADFPFFCEKYFGIKLPKHQVYWAQVANEPGNQVIFAPAAHGKTTLFAVLRTLWRITQDRFQRFIIASSTDTLSAEILSSISYQLMNNEKLIGDYGPYYSADCEWTNTSVRVLQSDYKVSPALWKPSGRKDPNLRAVGVGTSCLGKRCDQLVCDDLLNLRNSKTEELRRTIRHWFWNELEPCVDSGGQIIWVGNPVHRDDLSQELSKDSEYTTRIFKAIIDEQRHAVLWPEKRSYEWLAKRRERDPISFARRFQSIPVSDSDYVEWDKLASCFRTDLKLLDYLPMNESTQYKKLALFVDPAFTQKKRSSYSAVLCIGVLPDNKVDIIGAWKGKVLFDELIGIIKQKAMSYLAREVFVESNAQQWALVDKLSKTPGIPMVKPTYTSSAKEDPELGIGSVIRLFHSKMIIIRYGDEPSRRLMDDLCNEIAEYPEGEHDDLYMALYMGVRNLVNVEAFEKNKADVLRQEIYRPKGGYRIIGNRHKFRFIRPISKFSNPVRG